MAAELAIECQEVGPCGRNAPVIALGSISACTCQETIFRTCVTVILGYVVVKGYGAAETQTREEGYIDIITGGNLVAECL